MKNTQLGESATANFEENTWTFEMDEGFSVTAGRFAIIPVGQYYESLNKLQAIIENFPLKADMQDMKDNLISILKNLEQ